jgi:uncharacterized ferredoxin-like protein
MKRSKELEIAAIIDVAQLMAVAARTAPKTCGIDNIEVIAIESQNTRAALIAKMKELSKRDNRPSIERDANSIADVTSVIVIGVRSNPPGLNCGFCGYPTCDALNESKGVCAYNSIDLGIAVGSAVEIASRFHIDNRVMYSVGKAAIELKLLSADVKQALGIPLSATGKNPFFDRK